MARFEWHSASGEETRLDSAPFYVLDEISGHLLPTFDRREIRTSAYTHLLGIGVNARDLSLPLLIRASSLENVMRLCARYWNPLNGDGTLVYVSDSGERRQLACRYTGGLEGSASYNRGWMKAVLRLRALNPFWQATDSETYQVQLSEPVPFFQPQFFPLHISSGVLNGNLVIQNSGDLDSFPVFTVTGPATYLKVNRNNEVFFEFPNLTMNTGDVLVIDTRPGRYSAIINGENAFQLLSSNSKLFSFVPGENVVTIAANGVSAASKVYFEFVRCYWTI